MGEASSVGHLYIETQWIIRDNAPCPSVWGPVKGNKNSVWLN